MPQILFVCIENSCRSQMAEALARIHASPDVEIYSAGSKPSGKVNERAIQFMQEIGYDLSTHESISLNAIPDITYDAVITMGCGDECPYVKAKKREDWGIIDPKHLSDDEFRETRELIADKVKQLLQELSA